MLTAEGEGLRLLGNEFLPDLPFVTSGESISREMSKFWSVSALAELLRSLSTSAEVTLMFGERMNLHIDQPGRSRS